jgi:hypothetical protein
MICSRFWVTIVLVVAHVCATTTTDSCNASDGPSTPLDKVPVEFAPTTLVFRKDVFAASRRSSIPLLQMVLVGWMSPPPSLVICKRAPHVLLSESTTWVCSSKGKQLDGKISYEGYASPYDEKFFLRDSWVLTARPLIPYTPPPPPPHPFVGLVLLCLFVFFIFGIASSCNGEDLCLGMFLYFLIKILVGDDDNDDDAGDCDSGGWTTSVVSTERR